MTAFVNPDTVTDLRNIAQARIDEWVQFSGRCPCSGEDRCSDHLILELLVPTVEGAELPW